MNVLMTVWLLGQVVAADARLEANWPQFRGPTGDGHSGVQELPLSWSETENVVWKSAIHGKGWSTPVVWGAQVWLTTATPDGRDLFAICVDRESGKVLRDLRIFHVEEPEPLGNPVNCYASPSPAIEEGRVYVHFGSYGTVCLDTDTAEVIWTRRDLPCVHFRGPGSSPIIFEDLLILTFDGFDLQYLAALDKRTGKTVWRTERSYDFGDLDGDLRKAYSTPVLVNVGGRLQMLSSSAKATYSYDPRSGEELWRVRYPGFSNASMPVHGKGLVFVNTGFSKADLWAVRPTGRGDVTESHVVWRCPRGVPLKPSPILVGDWIFMAQDGGVATCLEAETGRVLWQQRIGGAYSASPIHGAGRIYFLGEDGTASVIRPGPTCEILATNRLDDGFMASPAVSGKSLILRTRTHLYRIEDGRDAAAGSASAGR